MELDMNIIYEAMAIEHGQDRVDAAAQASVEAYNTAAIAGLSQHECEREQVAVFLTELGIDAF